MENNDDFWSLFGRSAADGGPVEPAAELRQAAGSMFELFQAFVRAGFSEEQALGLIGTMLASAMRGSGEGGMNP